MFTKIPRLLILALSLTVILYFYPVNSLFFRTGFLVAILFAFCMTFLLLRERKILLGFLGLLFVTPVTLMCLPGKDYDVKTLNGAYLEKLRNYQGVRYVWGGENAIGIDCSGLPRRALIDAYREYGLRTLNGKLLREAATLWWFDSSARALMDNYRDQTIVLSKSDTINSIDPQTLHPGDFAVTADGVHVLNYLGNSQWIEADPVIGRVVIESVPTKNYWFGVPVVLMRWNMVR